MQIYPWQQEIWRQIAARRARLPHALLLFGPPGLGKLAFAQVLARSLLCVAPNADGLPCGSCESCNWIDAGVHPDYWLLQPEAERPDAQGEAGKEKKPSEQISVTDIRALIERLALASHRGANRAAIIEPAESLNPYAANALLKTLEEPPAGVTFLLVTHQPSRLPKTLLSRCERLRFTLGEPGAARQWLSSRGLAADALTHARVGPLQVERSADSGWLERRSALLSLLTRGDAFSVIEAARAIESYPVVETVGWLVRWCYDLVAVRLTGVICFHTDFAEAAHRLACSRRALDLITLYRRVQAYARLARHPLNTRLYLESLLIEYEKTVFK